MTRRTHYLRIVLALLCAAWCACHSAIVRADFEIESFTRYRIDRFDNNNNGLPIETEFHEHLAKAASSSEQVLSIPYRSVASSKHDDPFEKNATEYLDVITGSSDMPQAFQSSTSTAPTSSPQSQSVSSGFSDYGLGNVDFGDVLPMSEPFAEMIGNSYMQSCGMQLEKVVRFSTKIAEGEKKEWTDKNFTEVYYGFRYYQLEDNWSLIGLSGVIGQMSLIAEADNQMPGPHLGFNWSMAREDWQLAVGGFVQAGQYLGSTNVGSTIGEPLTPGQYYRSLYVAPSSTSLSRDEDFMTLLSVMKAQAIRALTKDVTLHLGCSGNYVGDVRYAADSVEATIPQFAIRPTVTDEIFITTVYTSLEFKR
jgi:hypothetical protein